MWCCGRPLADWGFGCWARTDSGRIVPGRRPGCPWDVLLADNSRVISPVERRMRGHEVSRQGPNRVVLNRKRGRRGATWLWCIRRLVTAEPCPSRGVVDGAGPPREGAGGVGLGGEVSSPRGPHEEPPRQSRGWWCRPRCARRPWSFPWRGRKTAVPLTRSPRPCTTGSGRRSGRATRHGSPKEPTRTRPSDQRRSIVVSATAHHGWSPASRR